MAIVNLAVPRNAQEGNQLHFTIDMQEVRIVQTTTVSSAPSSIVAKSQGKKTSRTLDETKDGPQRRMLKQIFTAAGAR